MADYTAADLYKSIAGGTQRANPWVGTLQEELQTGVSHPWDPAYEISDGAQYTHGGTMQINEYRDTSNTYSQGMIAGVKYRMYDFTPSPTPIPEKSPFPLQDYMSPDSINYGSQFSPGMGIFDSPGPDNSCPLVKVSPCDGDSSEPEEYYAFSQWMPYAKYNLGDIVKDRCVPYVNTLIIPEQTENVIAPEFSPYFTSLCTFDKWKPDKNYIMGENVRYMDRVYYKNSTDENGMFGTNDPPPENSKWTPGLNVIT
jgi:hypothetical protein